jgi:hypothetical protein
VADEGLDEVFGALAERASKDERLERYRVRGSGAHVLDALPPGWFPSGAVERIATEGGWWPGEWVFPTVDNLVVEVLNLGEGVGDPEPEVRWVLAGTVWERDCFYTPLLRQRSASAPLFGFSSQALWSSMVFPSEAALLEAFVVTYDEMGFGQHGLVNPFFVEWVTSPPAASEPDAEAAHRVHRRLAELSTSWSTAHRCWIPGVMPLLSDGIWPTAVVATVLGVEPARVHRRR